MKNRRPTARLPRVITESLESRLLFYTLDPNLVHALPYALDFSSAQGGFEDAGNEGTGFTRVQFNNAGNQHQPSLIDLDTAAGVLRLTTSGVAQSGTNLDGNNSLINGLGAAFDASTTPFAITVTLAGPMNYLDAAREQLGIMFGPDQDNYVKLVAVFESGRGRIDFVDEQTNSGSITHTLAEPTSTAIGPFGLIGSLKLRIIGDPVAGVLHAQYSINGGAFQKVGSRLTLTGAKKTAFFNNKGIASILAIQNNAQSPVTFTFDDFRIEGGSQFSVQPSVTTVNPPSGATDIPLDESITASISLPTAGTTIDASTLNSSTVKLVRNDTSAQIGANLSISGNMITLSPTSTLVPNVTYTFSITSGLKDSSGVTFQPFSSTFTTGINSDPGSISASESRLLFNASRGTSSPTQAIVITNTGDSPQTITSSDISITGGDAALFSYTPSSTLPVTLTSGQTLTLNVRFNPTSGTALGLKTAVINIKTQDTTTPTVSANLRSLATSGTGGANEPSLQRILDLYEIPLNVGDPVPSDTFLDVANTPNDELTTAQLLRRASAGNVTIEPIAAMAVNTEPALQLGYYEPGTPGNRTMVWSIPKADAQSVNPSVTGTTTFDPGANPFGLLTIWPGFTNTDGSTREVYSEDGLNTWETDTSKRHKVRFYPLKNSDGSTVANAYIAAFEEFTAGYDYQDVVVIVRNVQIVSTGPEIGTSNLDFAPYPDRLVFSRIQNPNTSIPNVVHDTATIRIRNTGLTNLVINSISVSSGWQILGSNTFPKTLAPATQSGDSFDLPIKFTATSGGLRTGTLTINSNDADEPAKSIALAGFWQQYSESTPGGTPVEPVLSQMMTLFGYQTQVVGAGQNLNTGGRATPVGEEVMSAYWKRADASIPITFRQLAAYHTQGDTASLRWFVKGNSGTRTTLFTHVGADAQTVLPRSTAAGNPQAFARLSTNSVIGFNVANEFSDDTLNIQESPGGGWGHHMRFYPVKDRNGAVVPNAYFLTMDYNGINYDYNDNVYLVTNIMPESGVAASPAFAAALPPSSSPFSTTTIESGEEEDEQLSAGELVDSV